MLRGTRSRAACVLLGAFWACLPVVAVEVTTPASSYASARRAQHPGTHISHQRRPHKGAVAEASIIGGTEAENGSLPYLAYVLYEAGGSSEQCTGTVLSANVILTARHFAEDSETGIVKEPSGYQIVTGNVEWTSAARQVTGVSKVVVYPGYVRSQL